MTKTYQKTLELYKEFHLLSGELARDVAWNVELLKKHPKKQWPIRSLIRASMTYIDGILNFHRNILNKLSTNISHNLSKDELDFIRGKKPKGFRKIEHYDSYTNGAFYTLLILLKALNRNHVQFKDHDWIIFENFVEIRNRLIHPENAKDLIVSSDETTKCIIKVLPWFISTWRKLSLLATIEQILGLDAKSLLQTLFNDFDFERVDDIELQTNIHRVTLSKVLFLNSEINKIKTDSSLFS